MHEKYLVNGVLILLERIFSLMNDRNVTAAELSKATEINKSTITQWKKGLQKPSTEAIVKIAHYFKVSTDYLLGKTDSMNDDIKDEDLKFALWGDREIDDDLLEEIRYLARVHKAYRDEQKRKKKPITFMEKWSKALPKSARNKPNSSART